MRQYIYKAVVTALVVLVVSELGKRTTFWGAAIASLPLMSITAFTIVYLDTRDTTRVADMSQAVFWLIIPSLLFFVLLPLALLHGVSYWLSLVAVLGITLLAYGLAIWVYKRLGIAVGH